MDTRALAQRFAEVVAPLGIDCLGVEWLPAGGDSCLRVYIELLQGERDIDVDDCEAASRELSAFLDVEDPVPGQYRLEVSSPGLDRPLFTLEQMAGAVGETVSLKLHRARDGSRRLVGTVLGVQDEQVQLQCEQGRIDVPFADVARARVEPDWDALGMNPAPRKGGHKGKRKRKRAHQDAGRS